MLQFVWNRNQEQPALMPPQQAAKTLKSSKAEDTGDPEMADATTSNGDSGVAASSSPILSAINAMKGEFVLRFDGLLSAIDGMQSDLKAVSVHVTEAEERMSTNQDDVASLKTQTNTIKVAIEELVSKVYDLENRARRSTFVWSSSPRR